MKQDTLHIQTTGRGTIELTDQIRAMVSTSTIDAGLCHVFCQHTSASLILCENYDPDVRADLERFTQRVVPDGDAVFQHTAEGPDDMSAHIRTILSHSDLTIPVRDGQLLLGTWQGIFLWEHRVHPHTRIIIVSVLG